MSNDLVIPQSEPRSPGPVEMMLENAHHWRDQVLRYETLRDKALAAGDKQTATQCHELAEQARAKAQRCAEASAPYCSPKFAPRRVDMERGPSELSDSELIEAIAEVLDEKDMSSLEASLTVACHRGS